MTEWRDIEGEFKDGYSYQVSDDGRVRALHELSQSVIAKRSRVSIQTKWGVKQVAVARLVADAFGIKGKRQIPINKDGNPLNNSVGNLE